MNKHFLVVLSKATLSALIIVGVGQGIWVSILSFNLKISPAIPWFVMAEGLVLYLFWRYAGGWGWPQRTREIRKTYRRANAVSANIFIMTLGAGILSLVALVGWWKVFYRLLPTSPNPILDTSPYSLITIISIVIIASIVAPVFEEVGCRGYCQLMLEKVTRPWIAILLSSIVFAVIHFTQGIAVSKFCVYFLVGVVLGSSAFVTNSILPGMIFHGLADVTFFLFVWPHDKERVPISISGPDSQFWKDLVEAILFSLLTVWAFALIYRRNRNKHLKTKVA